MSSTTVLKTEVHNEELLRKACLHIPGAKFLGIGKHELYMGSHHGCGIQLPGFYMPVIFNLDSGEVFYDSDMSLGTYHQLLQGYAKEVCQDFAQKNSYQFAATPKANGEIEVVITVGGDNEGMKAAGHGDMLV